MQKESAGSKPMITNPIIPGFYPDPSICRVGEDYWLATSSFEYFPGLPIFRSRDLVNWQLVGHALDRPEQLDLSGRESSEGIFAPTIRFHQGTYYLITTDVAGIGNFLMTAKDPRGPWSDPVRINDGDGFTWFDPSLFFDEDGTVYFTRRHKFEIVQAEIDLLSGELLTPLRKISGPFTSDDVEGPHLYKMGDTYYLMCAEGGTGWGHAISIGRSKSPWGPFEPCPQNPILTHRHLTNHSIRGVGHGDLVHAHDGSWWMVFHATRHREEHGFAFHHMGRETFLAPVSWEDGWPVINNNESIQYRMQGPALPRINEPETIQTSSGNHPALDPRWTWRRTPQPEQCQVLSEDSFRMTGLPASLNDKGPLAFLGQRLTQPDFTVRTELHFSPLKEGEEAGLTLFLSESFHAEIAIIHLDGAPRIITRRRAADLSAVVEMAEAPSSPIVLQIDGNWDGFTFSCRDDEGRLILSHTADRRLLCTEVATGWTGVFAGLYSTGNGRTSSTPAVFTGVEHTVRRP
jgi:alpha-N-arabinofuranosidase